MTGNRSQIRPGNWCDDPAAHIHSVCSLGLCRKRKGPLATEAAGHSDIGTVRKSNDDLVFASNDCRLYVVLDGVGGHAGGAAASLIVLDKLRGNIEAMCDRHATGANQDLEQGVRTALELANKSMIELADEHPEFARMSTVFALAYVIEGVLLYTHIGDCRVYVVRRGKATRLTTDETFVQLMVDNGAIEPEDVPSHPMKNVILNSIGTRSVEQDPIVHTMMLLPGDTLVMTTDGVTDYLADDALARIAASDLSPTDRSAAIVKAALEAGSRDNASCVVVQINRAANVGTDVRTDLHFELAKLHDLLSEVETVDDELRNDMSVVAEDLRRTLKQPRSNGAELTQLKGQLETQTLSFEARHPRITGIVSSIAELLARMGI